MKKNRSLFFLCLFLLCLASLSGKLPETIRERALLFFRPVWKNIHQLKGKIGSDEKTEEQLKFLQFENHRLQLEIEELKEKIQLETLLTKNGLNNVISAKVIYRSPALWNSSFWVDVGDESNQGKIKIAKNSPVLVGTSIVGVVEYVGKQQARVRLITDSALTPSVRASRKDEKNQIHYLAKGELQGSGKPLWRSEGNHLKGIGFNYDFADEYGPARDLQKGTSTDPSQKVEEMNLIAVGDLLITTGMDGIFPKGFPIATVTKVYPLNEGDYYYGIEAVPTASNIHDLSFVFILPPLGYERVSFE